MKYIQHGYNSKYPIEIEVWEVTNKSVPEWLTDRCQVRNIDINGNIILESRPINNVGGRDYFESGSLSKVLVSVKNEKDLICFGDSKLFTLSPVQLDLLYKEK